jgi:hypothetical protein
MEREQYQQVTVAVASGRLPRWLRIVLVLSLAVVAIGAGFYAYRYVTRPTTLTIAAGSLDSDVALIEKINEVKSEAELTEVERQIDEILKDELQKVSAGKLDEGEISAINLASQRLQYLMTQRRLALGGVKSVVAHG